LEDSSSIRRERRARSPRRPERQQILLRRGLALGGGLLLLILIVLGVKGCLDARKNRELSDYARNVTQIVEETEGTSEDFFGNLAEPGELSVTEFVAEVSADRSAMDNYATRVEGLSTPGDMGSAQDALELVYELRRSAMDEIADQMRNALGDVGAEKATEKIAKEMQTLLAADVLYREVARPEIDGVLAANGIEGDDVPESVFLAEGTTWLDESAVSAALGSVNGSTPAETLGVHGLGLIGTSVNGTELTPESTTAVVSEGAPEVEVQVANQGGSTENGIKVSVSVDGNALQGEIETIAAGETASASIPLTSAPSGTVTLEVDVATVPGEKISTNNKASYTVEFE
jgi:CARDB protein